MPVEVKCNLDVNKVLIEINPTSERLAEIFHDYLKYHIIKLAKSANCEVQFYV